MICLIPSSKYYFQDLASDELHIVHHGLFESKSTDFLLAWPWFSFNNAIHKAAGSLVTGIPVAGNYSLLGRTCEPEAFTVCKHEGLGVLPWGALDG